MQQTVQTHILMGAQVAYLKNSSAALQGWHQDAGASLHSCYLDRSVILGSKLEWRRPQGTEGLRRGVQWRKLAHDSFPFLGSGSDRQTSSPGPCGRNTAYVIFVILLCNMLMSPQFKKKKIQKICFKYVNNVVNERCYIINV